MWMLLACSEAPPVLDETAGTTLLRAEGTTIVDPEGEVVVFRGVNLGGWMFHETWITLVDYPVWGRFFVSAEAAGYRDAVTDALQETGAIYDFDALESALATRVGVEAADGVRVGAEASPSVYDDSDLPLRRVLEGRFGTDGRDSILDTFQSAWITDADLIQIASLDFNTVRVPIGYRSLVTTSDEQAVTELVWNEAAFDQLDRVLDGCAAHGLYAVLDLQESPGGHNDSSGPATLYTDPVMQSLTVELWEELSYRYGDRAEVAAYGLLAEPMSAPTPDARDAMYDELYAAIRAGGDDHLLVLHDGYAGLDTLPSPPEMGWTNVVYSTHLFEWGAIGAEDYDGVITREDAIFSAAQVSQDVPYFIGSFSTMVDADWAYSSARQLVDWYEARGWGWAWWTWKRIDDPLEREIWGTQTGWGVLREPWEGLDRPDVYVDDEATLIEKFEGYDGEMAINPGVMTGVAPVAGD